MNKEAEKFTRFEVDPQTGVKKYNWENQSAHPLSATDRAALFLLRSVWKENLGRKFGEVMRIEKGENYKGSSRWSPGKHLRQRMVEKFGEGHPWVESCSGDPGYTDSEFAFAVIRKKGFIKAIPLIAERVKRDGVRHEADLQKRRALEKQTPRKGMSIPWRALVKAWREVPSEADIHTHPLRRAVTIIALVPIFPAVSRDYGLFVYEEEDEEEKDDKEGFNTGSWEKWGSAKVLPLSSGVCRDSARKLALAAEVAGTEAAYFVTKNYDHILTVVEAGGGRLLVSDNSTEFGASIVDIGESQLREFLGEQLGALKRIDEEEFYSLTQRQK